MEFTLAHRGNIFLIYRIDTTHHVGNVQIGGAYLTKQEADNAVKEIILWDTENIGAENVPTYKIMRVPIMTKTTSLFTTGSEHTFLDVDPLNFV